MERRLIGQHRNFPSNCNTADGGEEILPHATYSFYGFTEPWVDGRIFYVGIKGNLLVPHPFRYESYHISFARVSRVIPPAC